MDDGKCVTEVSAGPIINPIDDPLISVLLVEEEHLVSKVAKELLELGGKFQVDTVYSVQEAYEKLKQRKYDAIVSDYCMPEKDGLQFLKELRESGNSIPFIIFTGKGREEVAIKELLNLGADGYFEKHGEPEAVYRELAHGISEAVEKKRIKDALGSSQAKYRFLLQNFPGMVYRALPDWSTEIVANSKSVCGYTIQEFDSGRVNWLDIIHPDDKARVVKEGGIILEGPASIIQEYRIVDKESGVRWVEDHKTSFFSKNGVFEGIDGFVFDVTSRKKTEHALHTSLDRYRSFSEVTEQLGWTTNADGEVVEDTPSFRKFTGQTYEEVKGWGWTKALHPDDLERATQTWKEANRTKSKYEAEYRLRRHDGVYRYFITRGVPVHKEDGSIGEWVGTCIDITERRKAEQTLKESEEKYRSLVELAPDGIVAVNTEGIVTSVNRSFLTLVGYDSEEGIVGKPFTELKTMRMQDIPRFQGMFMSLMKGESPSPVEFFYVRRDGTSRWAEVHPALLTKDGNPAGLQVIMRDVTERKKTEKTLQESEERFRAIFEGANDGILAADAKTKRFAFANPRICEITGYSSEELLKLGVGDIVPKKDLPYVIDSFEKQRQGKVALSKDIPVLRKDERVIYCDVSSRPIKIGSQEYLVGFFRDVTERKKAEECLKEMNKKLEATNEKLHVVGDLTRHDVRNKLSTVTGNVYLLRRKLIEDPKALEQLTDMEAAVRLVEGIFEFARNYERLGVEELAYMDVGKAVEGAVSLFSDLKGVKVVNECGGLTVLADSLLRQLFYNLIDNSLKYGEKIRQIKIHYNTLNADQLELVYEDDGVGIPNNMRSNLFKEGFTSGKGTGYGLYMIKRICEVYGWTIQETGKQGKGAQFTMLMPRIGSTGKSNCQIQNPRQQYLKKDSLPESSSVMVT